MSAVQPVAVYAMRIPPGDIMVPAVPEFAAMFRVTMAAIDPTEEPEEEATDSQKPPRATLKVVRVADDMLDEDDSDLDDLLNGLQDDDDEEDSDDEEENGGPSDKKSAKQKLKETLTAAAAADEDEDMDDDADESDEDEDGLVAAALQKLLSKSKGKGKGKGKVVNGEEDEEDEDDDEEDEDEDDDLAGELDEVVLCTLDPNSHYQQPLDFVVGEGEKVFFKVSGTHTIHLTGNYVMPLDEGGPDSLYDDDYDDEDVDLSPDEDELDELEALDYSDEESDELDDLEDPRITEIEDAAELKPKGLEATAKKGKNKRPADESDEDNLDDLMAKSLKKGGDAIVNGDSAKLTKAEKKAAKKLKKNDGEAVATENAKKEAQTNGSEKKVQFSKDLVQGPTPSATPRAPKDDAKKIDPKSTGSSSTSIGIKTVQGITIDDRKIGSGPAAKKGSRLEMRYIGKLESGKVFDSNKSGSPFSFKIGVGEVIKGWDIGLEGISPGGERRITVPPSLAYGNKALPGIPKNSKLIFDVKCLSVK